MGLVQPAPHHHRCLRAGGGKNHLKLELPLEAGPQGVVALDAQVSGLLGGHSGLDIE